MVTLVVLGMLSAYPPTLQTAEGRNSESPSPSTEDKLTRG